MREIEFRGKRIKNGEWLYGDLLHNNEQSLIHPIPTEPYEYPEDYDENVDPATVGQFTGLRDKNGTKIFEGDIVNNGERVRYATGQERWFGSVGVVRYDTKNGCLVINNDDGRTKRLTVKVIKNNSVKVIGNIHDNPELGR